MNPIFGVSSFRFFNHLDEVRFPNFNKFNECLHRNDFETIIKSKDLFWLAYCKAFQPYEISVCEIKFCFSIKGDEVIFSGNKILIEPTQNFVEELRLFYLEALESKNSFEILAIKGTLFYRLRRESPLIQYQTGGYAYYRELIRPALPKLAEFCGTTYMEGEKSQQMKIGGLAYTESVEVIKIQWNKECHLSPLIPPISIPEKENLDQSFYSLYKQQLFCDFSLISKDDVVKVHSNLLYINGGAVLQKLLTSEMKETENRTISFTEYSQDTIKAFVKFIYLGGKAFSEKVVASKNKDSIDLFELFVFANVYQVTTLIDCCTNLISLFATKQNLDDLKQLANIYQNHHLKEFCEHFSVGENAIKV